MELYKVPNNTKIRIMEENPRIPPAALPLNKGDVLDFHHVDGMYSLCYDKNGNAVHLAAWEEVEIVE